jgi:hypothetical protein
MATTATETATKPSRQELVQQMDPASSHQETKKVQRISSLQNTSTWKSELQRRGHQIVRNELQWSQRNGRKEKSSRRNEPPCPLFPYCKAAKDFPTVTQYRHLSNPFDCMLKRIWELASFGKFCCSFCMSLFCICPRGFCSCNLDI